MLILASFKHDTAAALFEDGKIVAAIENDKLVRSKSVGLPENAINFCLAKIGASWRDLDLITVGMRPFSSWRRRSLLPFRLATRFPFDAIVHETTELGPLPASSTSSAVCD